MRIKQVIALFLILSLTVGSASVAQAFGGKCGGGRGAGHKGGGKHLFRMLMDLDLSDAQLAEVSGIMKSQCASMKAEHEKMRELMAKGKDLVMTDSFDEAAVRKNAEEIAAIKVDMMVNKARVFHNVYKLLDDGQKRKLKAKMAERKAKMEKMKEMHIKFKKHFGNPGNPE